MKRFIAFVKKETYHITRDIRTLILLFVIPIVLVLLFGFAITTEIKEADIAILDKSKDKATRTISNKIEASKYFKVTNWLQTSDDIEKVFKQGEIELVIVFPENFYQDLKKYNKASLQIIADAVNPNTANTLQNFSAAVIRDYQMSRFPLSTPRGVEVEIRMLYNPQLESAFYFVPGLITVIITLVCAMMTSVTIAREKEFGTMEILLVSPLKPLTIILGKSIPYMFIAMIDSLIILFLGFSIFEIPLSGSFILLIAECFLFVLTSLSLGLLISTRVKTQKVALMISLIGLFLPTMLLSGFIFPIESMPSPLQWISNIVPAKWFIIIVKSIMLKGVGLQVVWKDTVILGGMTLFFLLFSIRSFNIRLE